MVAELCLDRAEDLVQLAGEDGIIELLYHLPGAESTEITPTQAGSAGRLVLGNFGEIGASLNLGFELQALGFCLY